MKPLGKTPVLWLVGFLFFGVLAACFSKSMVPGPDPEEYQVYHALISERFLQGHSDEGGIKTLVIEDRTGMGFDSANDKSFAEGLKKEMGLDESVAKDFALINQKPYPLYNLFGFKSPVRMVDQATLDGFSKNGVEGYWDLFYKKFPDSQGLITLSRVGFNSTRTQALVYIGNSCGGLCGTGYYVRLDKQGNVWKVTKNSMAWIS